MFSRLNTSTRSSIACRAPIGTRRISARSTSRYDGPRTGLREADPIVNCGRGERRRVEPVARRPLVGGQRRIADEIRPLRREAGEAREVVACVTAIGMPDCSVMMRRRRPVVHQRAEQRRGGASHGPRPTGRSHTADATK